MFGTSNLHLLKHSIYNRRFWRSIVWQMLLVCTDVDAICLWIVAHFYLRFQYYLCINFFHWLFNYFKRIWNETGSRMSALAHHFYNVFSGSSHSSHLAFNVADWDSGMILNRLKIPPGDQPGGLFGNRTSSGLSFFGMPISASIYVSRFLLCYSPKLQK